MNIAVGTRTARIAKTIWNEDCAWWRGVPSRAHTGFSPSPWMGEGWGGGEIKVGSMTAPHPNPLPQGGREIVSTDFSPSPWMGEGWGGGEIRVGSMTIPRPNPLPQAAREVVLNPLGARRSHNKEGLRMKRKYPSTNATGMLATAPSNGRLLARIASPVPRT